MKPKRRSTNQLAPPIEQSATAMEISWIAIAFERQVVFRSLCIAMIVGTILVAINHGISICNCTFNYTCLWQSILTYMVPYTVSTVSSTLAMRAAR